MLSDYQNLVARKVRDDSNRLTATDVDDAIEAARVRYSKDRPRSIPEDVTADGTQTLATPPSWVPGFSDIQSIEYPIGEVPPQLYAADAYTIYNAPGGEEIQLADTPTSGQDLRVTFTVFHTLTQSADTIPLGDRDAVANWAAAELCGQLASLYSADSDSTIAADAVAHKDIAARWTHRAEKLRARYRAELGLDDKRYEAAGTVVDLDLRDSRNRDRLTHPERYR